MRAAKNRQRARLGLPPLDPEEEEKAEEENEETIKKRQEEEEAKRKMEEEEKMKESERQQYVRPWDKDKIPEDAPKEWEYKAEREPMSQEQWVELKRQERPQEFAPIAVEGPSYRTAPSQPDYQSDEYVEESKQLFFTSKKKPQQFKKRNYIDEPPSVPIRNELSDDSDEDSKQKGAEIAPPATYEYYGPSSSKQSRPGMSQLDLERSIEAGLKFLRDQSSKGGNKNKWAANSDY